MTNAREWASICGIPLLLAWLELDMELKTVPTQPDIPWRDMPDCECYGNDRDPRRFLDESHNDVIYSFHDIASLIHWRFSRVLAANERLLFTGTVVIISHRVESSKAKMEANEMDDFTLIKEIFRRLDDNFYDLDDPYKAETDSDIAADALVETLFNMGLDYLYIKEDCVVDGLLVHRFTVKVGALIMEARKSRWVYEVGNDTRYLFTDATPLEALQKMIYTLNLDHKCEPVINKTESGSHLWFEDRGITYAVALK